MSSHVLTIVVPTYNMEKYLRKNLNSLAAVCKKEKIEVLIIDNASSDNSGKIADEFANMDPETFIVIHKENYGYGSSINLAIKMAKGQYLRIVDADDWINPEELIELIQDLKKCTADLVISNYIIIDIQNNTEVIVEMRPHGITEGNYYCIRDSSKPFPKMHSTIFSIEFLRKNKIFLLEDTCYVDEQLMLLACLYANSLVYYDHNVYCYRLGDANQSVSATNMGKLYADRERELKDCLTAYKRWTIMNGPMVPCLKQLIKHAGNHFTTLYMYVEPATVRPLLAKEWHTFLYTQWPEIAQKVAGKRWILAMLNKLHLDGKRYVVLHTMLEKLKMTLKKWRRIV